jgi:signal transduction histidine kinase
LLRKAIKVWQNHRRLILVASLLAAVAVILWNSYVLFRHIKEEERAKMEIWASAVQNIIDSPINTDLSLALKIVSQNKTIPVIMTDSTGKIIEVYNLGKIKQDTVLLRKKLRRFKNQNEPLRVDLDNGYQLIYYGDSKIFNILTWYPFILLLIFGLFVLIGYLYYFTAKVSEQNQLWAAMAKETAHQIGTPLSSLLGWLELMKIDPASVPPDEMQKDVYRLEIISRRFSKIGSKPQLFPSDINETVKQTVQYFKYRLPENIRLVFKPFDKPLYTKLNAELFQWVMENLIKNAVDAMPNGGKIEIRILETPTHIIIDVEDEGNGIPKNLRNKIFEAGFSTKKRGWGLGLSVVKRIIRNYHEGHIFVRQSVPGKGSIFRIKLKKTTS